VDRVAEVIKREFEIDPKNSVDKRETEADKFGYYALNYVCKYSEKRTSQVEYKKFTDVWCEIQITSILRHTWSELEHPWYDLKDAFPPAIKRRFARMAALLEIAESEFLNLSKVQSDYQKSVALQVEANVPDLVVDAVSFRSFIEHEPLVAELDKSLTAILGATVQNTISDSMVERRMSAVIFAGMTKIQDVRSTLKRFERALPKYLERCKKEIWSHLRSGAEAPKGFCLYHLGLILMNIKGKEATLQFLEAVGFKGKIEWDVERQVTIAKEVFAKYVG
jgi:putative GTP pyrophosphokinase